MLVLMKKIEQATKSPWLDPESASDYLVRASNLYQVGSLEGLRTLLRSIHATIQDNKVKAAG